MPDSSFSSSEQPPRRRARRRRIPSLISIKLKQKTGLAERVQAEVKQDLPGILLSLGLHALVLFVLALIPILLEPSPSFPILELAWAVPENVRPPKPVDSTGPIRLTRPPASAAAPTPKENKPREKPDRAVPRQVAPVPVSGSLGGRRNRDLDRLRRRDGFVTESRKALNHALQWIVQQQRRDGSWSLSGPYPDGANQARWSTDAGATSLALLALLGDGQTHQDGKYSSQVGKGIDWLMSIQRPTGEIYDGTAEGEEPSIYSHAIATIVLCEALALTGDKRLRQPAQRAVDYLISIQNPLLGGWRYRPLTETGEGDLSVTGWALMALHTARMADLELDPNLFIITSNFLDRCQEMPGDASRYKYLPSYPPDPNQRVSMTSSGLLARQWLGWPKDHPALIQGTRFLLDEMNRPVWEDGKRNVYAWYYQAQVLHNMGGEDWKSWFAHTQQVVVEHQEKKGRQAGSWHPTRPAGNLHEWSTVAGRLYVTVLCVLILETPLRHAPLYDVE